MGAPRATLELLGGFALRREAGAVPVRLPSRAQALVASLALRPGEPIGRGALAGLLWPESTEEQARTNLRKALHHLRREAPELASSLARCGEALCWVERPDEGATEVDVHVFRCLSALATVDALRAAADVYRGPLLPELADAWVVEAREALGHVHRRVLETLVELLASRGERREALDRLDGLIAADPYLEERYRQGFALAAAVGDHGALAKMWSRCAGALGELGAEPSDVTRRAFDTARVLVGAPQSGGGAVLGQTWGQLVERVEDEMLVGRGDELERLRGFVDGPSQRILVVHGVAGAGKSALLRAFARWLRRRGRVVGFVDGRRIPATRAGLWAALGVSNHAELVEWASASGAVVLIDAFEAIGPVGGYLAEELVPALGDGARLVLAVRSPVAVPWPFGSPWRRLVGELELDALGEDEARAYLSRRGLESTSVIEQLVARFGTTPLALSQAADVALVSETTPLEERAAWRALVSSLVEAWLCDVHAVALRELVAAASVVRAVDQDLLSVLVGRRVRDAELVRLVRLAVVRVTEQGYMLHDDLRRLLLEDLEWRAPERLRRLRLAALGEYRRRIAAAPPGTRERLAAEHLFLSGDAIVRDLLFSTEGQRGFVSVEGGPADLEDLEAVLHAWGDERMAEPRSAEMRKATRAILAYRGTVLRLVRRRYDGALLGFAAAVPLCRETLGLLLRHPGIAPYVEVRWTGREDVPEAPRESRCYHFAYAAYLEEGFRATRAMLIREMVGLLARGGVYSLSTPDREYQALAETLGFRRVSDVRHTLYGRHHPCEHYELDLTEVGFVGWVDGLMRPFVAAGTASSAP